MRRIVWMVGSVLWALSMEAWAAPETPEAQAIAAYNAKQYARCAELFLSIAEKKQGEAAADPLYSVACCHALDGKSDKAFALLDRSVAAGLRNRDHVEVDTDLVSLHADPRWPRMLAAMQARIDAWEKTLGDAALRRELLAMVKEDQRLRFALIKSQFKDQALQKQLAETDRKNTARVKEIVAARGWPGKSLVARDGAHAAWLLVQHADHDVAFQKLCLGKLEPLVKTGEVEAKDYAYLVDRVAVAEKRKQVYGTQFDERREPRPIEDEAHVDERRKAVGLPPLAEYKQDMLRMYGPPAPAAPATATPATSTKAPAK